MEAEVFDFGNYEGALDEPSLPRRTVHGLLNFAPRTERFLSLLQRASKDKVL